MPIGGANGIGWDENSPPDTESAGLGDDRIRSTKSSVRQTLDSEHNFPSTGGDSVGYHRFGSARPYYGAQSLVSSSGSDGRLMLTSDTSRLFAVGSGGTSFIGGATVISAGSFPGAVPQRHYWAFEFGLGRITNSASTTVSFPNSGFSGAPFVFANIAQADVNSVFVQLGAIDATTFGADIYDSELGTGSNGTFAWFSIGSRAF